MRLRNIHDSLNTTIVVVLEVLFPYGFIYKLVPPMSEKYVKESQSPVVPPLFTQAGGRGMTWRANAACSRRVYLVSDSNRDFLTKNIGHCFQFSFSLNKSTLTETSETARYR